MVGQAGVASSCRCLRTCRLVVVATRQIVILRCSCHESSSPRAPVLSLHSLAGAGVCPQGTNHERPAFQLLLYIFNQHTDGGWLRQRGSTQHHQPLVYYHQSLVHSHTIPFSPLSHPPSHQSSHLYSPSTRPPHRPQTPPSSTPPPSSYTPPAPPLPPSNTPPYASHSPQ